MPVSPHDALLDWLACAVAGRGERAARAADLVADGLPGRVAALGTAGHVLDFDDTYLPGLAHLSAAVAPAAVAVAASVGADVDTLVAAYADGVEAMGALTRAAHPTLYDGGWHPTAVCGGLGAAVAAARLLGLQADRVRDAGALALLRASGLRAAFGADGKALQVGLAAASGVDAARLVAAGVVVDADTIERGVAGFRGAFGVEVDWGAGAARGDTFDELWIKAYPCCLQTHGAIEAAMQAASSAGVRAGTPATVVVHPVSRQAAALDDVRTGLEAKFSIPYLVAHVLRHGLPDEGTFTAVDAVVRRDATSITVETDAALLESEALVRVDGTVVGHATAALGSPRRPLDAAALARKVTRLAGTRLDGALDDGAAPAATVAARLEASG